MILTPDHPDFYQILHSSPPPGWQEKVDSDWGGCFAVRQGSLLLEPLSPTAEKDYLWGGEYDSLDLNFDADPNS